MPAPRPLLRIAVNIALDGALAALAVPLARWIADPAGDWLHPLWAIPAGAVALLLAGLPFRLSLQYWRFAGLGDLIQVAGCSVLGALLFALMLAVAGVAMPNPAWPVVHAFTLLALLGAPRVFYRRSQVHTNGRGAEQGAGGSDILLVGASEDADLFLRALAQERRQSLRVIGLLALGSRQTGRRIQGYPILGSADDVGTVLERLKADDRLPAMLVVATPDLSGTALARLIDEAQGFGLVVRRAPRPTALHPATHRAEPENQLQLKPVAIEDLLNRPQVPLDREGMARLIQGRRVIVTGAGGTIGSELARQVAAFGPEMLILLDNGEYALWQIDLELAETHPLVVRKTLIADIRDQTRIRAVFEEFRPQLVFHAAALKHVPMVESNPLEGLLTNIAGTANVADAARATGALAMVLISTDKAVNPTSVMGASKRVAEMYCQALDVVARGGGTASNLMRCVTVRFGNVLGSTGSVVPLFQRQLERGGPLTVTHPDMQRYFMTVREAVGLVLQASVLGAGDATLPSGRDGGIFVLDMGKPVKIVDLARQMIRLAGLRPDDDVEIRFTGLRPGEKLFEELFHGKEPPIPTGYPGLLMATPRTADPAIVGRAIEEIATACRSGQTRQALTLLGRLIPEFEHNADGAGSVRA
jgi:O-antigen biosynthesis protein WbqV